MDPISTLALANTAIDTAKKITSGVNAGGVTFEKQGKYQAADVANLILGTNFGKSNPGLAKTNGRITSLLTDFVIEPAILTTRAAKESSIYLPLLNLEVDIYASHWLQAFEVLKNFHGVNVNKALDLLSTKTSSLGETIGRKLAGAAGLGIAVVENYAGNNFITNAADTINKYTKLSLDPLQDLLINGKLKFTSDNANIEITLDAFPLPNQVPDEEYKNKPNAVVKDDYKKQLGYAALERKIQITYTISGKTTENNKKADTNVVTIPITIKGLIIESTIENIIRLLENTDYDKTFAGRRHEYKSGAISWKDFLFGGDLIKKDKQRILRDENELIKFLNEKERTSNANNYSKGFVAQSNMLVMSTSDIRHINSALLGDFFKEENVRQELLNRTKAINVAVIDEDYERVGIATADHRGLVLISFKQLQNYKPSSDTYENFIQSLLLNKPISF